MMVSVPPLAPTTPPETGASTKRRPVAITSPASAAASAGPQVAMKITSASGARAARAPPSNSTDLAWAALTTMSTSASASRAAPAALPARDPPALSTAASASALRSKPRTEKPFATSRCAMGSPMAPRPTKPISFMRSFFDRTRHRRDVVLDEEGIEHDEGQRADEGAGHQRAPAIDVAVDELVHDRDRHGLVDRRGDEGQRVDELVPAQGQREDRGRDQARDRERQDDLGEDLPAARAVDQGALLELVGDRLEVPHQQPGRERDQDRRIDQDEGENRVEQAVLMDHGRERDEQDRGRHEVGEEDHAADGVRAAVADAGDGVGR